MSIATRVRTLGSETIIYGVSGAISRSIGIFLVPLYTRIFTPEDYGVIAMITAAVGLLTTGVVLGMDNASARWFYDTQDVEHQKSVISGWFWLQLFVALLVVLPIYLAAAPVSQLLLDSTQYASLVQLAAASVPLTVAATVLSNWLRYQRRATMTAIFNTATSLGTIALIVLYVLVWRWGLAGIFAGRLVAALLTTLATVCLMRSWIFPRYISLPLLKEMLLYGLPLAPAGVAAWITASSDRFILKFFVPTSEIGLYAIASTFTSAIVLLTSAFQMAWGPFAYSIVHEPESKLVYAKVFSIYAWLGCLVATGLTLFTPLALQILTPASYYPAASSVSFLAFSYIALGATFIASLGSSIVKKAAPIATSIFIGAGANIGLNFALIPIFERDGAAVATLIAYLVAASYLFRISQQHYFIPYRFKDAWICFGFAWLLIVFNQLFLPPAGVWVHIVRFVMCVLFVPLAIWLHIINPAHFKQLLVRIANR